MAAEAHALHSSSHCLLGKSMPAALPPMLPDPAQQQPPIVTRAQVRT